MSDAPRSPPPDPRKYSPLAKLLGILFYLLVIAVLLLGITAASWCIVHLIRTAM